MKFSSILLGALLAFEASSAATPLDKRDDYSQLEALVQQAHQTAQDELAAQGEQGIASAKPGQPKCTLQNLSIRREW